MNFGCYMTVSNMVLALAGTQYDAKYYLAHENTGRFLFGGFIFSIFSQLPASGFTALLAAPGSMALGVVGIYAFGIVAGKIWNKCLTKIFNWFS